MKVVLPDEGSALDGIRHQLKRFKAVRGALPKRWPVFPSEFRRAAEELRRRRKNAGAGFRLMGVMIVPAQGTFFWRARTWVHSSLAGEIRRDGKPVNVMRDLDTYRAAAGDVARGGKRPIIRSRSEHREFLKRNGYTELGNELPRPRPQTCDRQDLQRDLKQAYETGMTPEARAAAERAQRAVE